MDPVAPAVIAAWDPGSAHNGLAASPLDRSVIYTEQIEIGGDYAGVPARIVEWLLSVEATELVIEWGRAFPAANPAAMMAQQADRDRQIPMLYAVAALCRQHGIAVASDETIRESRGPGLCNVSRWRSVIGAEQKRDAEGRPVGVKDSTVRGALVRHIGADVVATLKTNHVRDAVGLLWARLIGGPMGEEVPHERGKRAYTEHVRRKAAGRQRRRTERARAARALLPPPPPTHAQRAAEFLATCPQGARAWWVARRLGLTEQAASIALARAVEDGAVVKVSRGVYVLAKKS